MPYFTQHSLCFLIHFIITTWTSNDCTRTIDDVLTRASVDREEYVEALQVTKAGNVVLLKREPNEQKVNNYNASVMLAWQANMDIQYVLDAYACVMYVASYIMKTEKSMGVLLKQVAAEARTEELRTQLRKIGSAFLDHREVSAQGSSVQVALIAYETIK